MFIVPYHLWWSYCQSSLGSFKWLGRRQRPSCKLDRLWVGWKVAIQARQSPNPLMIIKRSINVIVSWWSISCVCVFSSCELWCGQSKAKITVFNLDVTSGSLQTVKVTGSDNDVTTSADVVHLCAGMSDSRPVMWTYVYPGRLINLSVRKISLVWLILWNLRSCSLV